MRILNGSFDVAGGGHWAEDLPEGRLAGGVLLRMKMVSGVGLVSAGDRMIVSGLRIVLFS
jgi:hypothetical protein